MNRLVEMPSGEERRKHTAAERFAKGRRTNSVLLLAESVMRTRIEKRRWSASERDAPKGFANKKRTVKLDRTGRNPLIQRQGWSGASARRSAAIRPAAIRSGLKIAASLPIPEGLTHLSVALPNTEFALRAERTFASNSGRSHE